VVPTKSSELTLCFSAVNLTILVYVSELKKDPGVPKLPDLKVKHAEREKARAVNLAFLILEAEH
jgi:hypothetical protein